MHKKDTEKEIEKQKAIKYLKTVLRPGDTVYCFVRHVSSSGMSRVISFYAIKKNKPVWLDYQICKAVDYRYSNAWDGVYVSGCGMDMAFHVTYNLARTLWPKGNGRYITGRNGDTAPETDGGYLLKSSRL